jgi:hypothetical protein
MGAFVAQSQSHSSSATTKVTVGEMARPRSRTRNVGSDSLSSAIDTAPSLAILTPCDQIPEGQAFRTNASAVAAGEVGMVRA